MNRRYFLAASTLALPGCTLTGNAPNTTVDSAISLVANDAGLIANGLQGVLTQLPALNISGLTPAILAEVGSDVADAKALAVALAGATSAAAAQPIVQKIETYVNTIVSTLAVLPLPPPISTALQAAAILLPVIEAAVGLIVGPQASRGGMAANEARLVLAAAAAKR